jgi:hypothetical protein
LFLPVAGISVNLCISQGIQVRTVLESENPPPNTPQRVVGSVKDYGRAACLESPNKEEKEALSFAKIKAPV